MIGMTSPAPKTVSITRRDIINTIFGNVVGRRFAVIGMGGGGDVVSTMPLCWELERLGADPIPGGLTWKRIVHDPAHRPRTLDEFAPIRRIAPHIALCGPDTETVDGIRHVEADISKAMHGRDVLILDPSGGSRAIVESMRVAQSKLSIDAFIGVDVGGDVLCNGHETTLESPLCDQTILHALAEQRATIILASVGTDGEIHPSDFISRFATIRDKQGFLGAFEPHSASLEEWERIVHDAKTESSKFAIDMCKRISPERAQTIRHALTTEPLAAVADLLATAEPFSLRGGARTGFLSELTAFYLGFDARTVWESGSFSTFWNANASIREMNTTLRARGIKTELTERR